MQFIYLALLLVSLSFNAHSAESGRPIENGQTLEELSAVISDRTITHIGHEFYRLFCQARQLKYPSSPVSLVIRERPSARWGNLIWIEYRSERVFENIWAPGRGQLDELADQAAEQIEKRLVRVRLRELLSDSLDMDKGEL